MDSALESQKREYARLLVGTGVNLQPGQSLRISAEIAHRGFVRRVAQVAYEAGAKYVQVDWIDTPTAKERFLHSQPEYLDYFPRYEIDRHQYMLDNRWARLALVGPEYPDVFDAIDPSAMRRAALIRSQMLKFYMDKVMANAVQWCVAAVPTRAWAVQVFPNLPGVDAVDQLWRQVLHICRVNMQDPSSAWLDHNTALNRVVGFLAQRDIRRVHFLDSVVDEDGIPRTDLTVGLTDQPVWLGAAAETPDGTVFFPNMPTEEVFSTPHRLRTDGWVRTSKPAYPFEREVTDAYFRFVDGEVVEYEAVRGKEVLDELFSIDGARRLGEVALVDIGSPVNQTGLMFYETLYDENATCHIAFGNAYPDGMQGGSALSEEELAAAGVNQSPSHVDVMIGTETMNVLGECGDGSTVAIMENGRFMVSDTEG